MRIMRYTSRESMSSFDDLIASFQPATDDACADDDDLAVFTCKMCAHVGVDTVDGYVFCENCGEVQDNVMDTAAEWRSFSDGKAIDSGRCGMPTNPLLPNSALSTVMTGSGNNYIKKLQAWGSSNPRDLAKYRLFVMVQQQTSRARVTPAVLEQTQKYIAQLCDKLSEDKSIIRGSNRKGMIAACLHFAFKKVGCPRSTIEVADIFAISQSCVTLGIKLFGEVFHDESIISDDKPVEAGDLVPRFVANIGAPQAVTEKTLHVIKKVSRASILSNNIVEAQAAACIWFTLKLLRIDKNYSKSKISSVCGISAVTLSKCVKKIEDVIKD